MEAKPKSPPTPDDCERLRRAVSREAHVFAAQMRKANADRIVMDAIEDHLFRLHVIAEAGR